MANIMIVDDSLFMRMSLKAIMDTAGHNVVGMAENGKDAIDLYRKLHPNVITLDVNMEGMDGLAALKILMEENPKPIVFMISADKQQATVERAKMLGAAGFISKPFNPKAIGLILAKALDNPE
ncbi:MAG: response regulator [Elusimicrobiota bacterium]|nr:response regulator [Elusimicrobiota bacterium]